MNHNMSLLCSCSAEAQHLAEFYTSHCLDAVWLSSATGD